MFELNVCHFGIDYDDGDDDDDEGDRDDENFFFDGTICAECCWLHLSDQRWTLRAYMIGRMF